MNFQELLEQASHNAEMSTRVVNELDRESQNRQQELKKRYEQDLQREREERKRKATPKIVKEFKIPKKKKNLGEAEDVDPNNVQEFLRKQRQTEMEKELEKKEDRNRLIALRLQANQGRATKKIASQVGQTPLQLQRRFGNNTQMEMELVKRQQREADELERKSKAIRDSISKATENRASLLSRMPSNNMSNVSRRVGNIKSDGFAALSDKHENITTKRKIGDKSLSVSADRLIPKKRVFPANNRSGGPVDFQALMQQAQQNTNAKLSNKLSGTFTRNIANDTQPQARTDREIMRRTQSNVSNTTVKSTLPLKSKPSNVSNPFAVEDRKILTTSTTSRNKVPIPNKTVPFPTVGNSSSQSRINKPTPTIFQRPVAFKSEPRYLPGDLRYKGPPVENIANKSNNTTSSVTTNSMPIGTSFAERLKKIIPNIAPKTLPNELQKNKSSSTSVVRCPASSQPPMKMSSVSQMNVLSTNTRQHRLERDQYGSSSTSASRNQLVHTKKERSNNVSQSYADRDRFNPRTSTANLRVQNKSNDTYQKNRTEKLPTSRPVMFDKNRRYGNVSSSSSFISRGDYYSDDDDYRKNYDDDEDEYDSDLDSFIDDTEVDELARVDFEDTLRVINPKYDRKVWKMREKMIDERHMDARFRDVEAEEKRSARLAFKEDLLEARKGSKDIS